MFPYSIPETLLLVHEGAVEGAFQLSHRPGSPLARIRFLSPTGLAHSDPGAGIIEALLSHAGKRGIQNLLAETALPSAEFDFLRRKGFAVYAKQVIWKGIQPPVENAPRSPGLLRPCLPKDTPGLLALYAAVVPSMVHQVETHFLPKAGWVLVESGEITGFFRMQSGTRGLWIEPFFHPGQHTSTQWLSLLLNTIAYHGNKPLFLCVRSYQNEICSGLADLGLAPISDQGVLVRRIAIPVTGLHPLQLPVTEPGATHVTTLGPHVNN